MSNRRITAVVAAVALASFVIALVGRWEANRATNQERRGIARIFAAVSPHPRLDGWRITPAFRCLFYGNGTNPFAYEFCFDSKGALVEALDRTSDDLVVSTLRSQPQDAVIHVSSSALDAVLTRMGAYKPNAPRNFGLAYYLYRYSTKPHVIRAPEGSGLP